MNKKKNIFAVLIIMLILIGCQRINIDYIGETYPKTAFAKIFFKAKEVGRPYKIIGKAIVRASTSFSTLAIQKKLRKTAENEGANALIILSYKEVPAGMYAYNNYPMWGMYDGMYGWGGMGCMYPNNYGPYWGEMDYGGFGMGEESVQCYYDYVMRVVFIRYVGKGEGVSNNDNSEIYLNGKPIESIDNRGTLDDGSQRTNISDKKISGEDSPLKQ